MGRIVEEAPPDRFFTNPEHERTAVSKYCAKSERCAQLDSRSESIDSGDSSVEARRIARATTRIVALFRRTLHRAVGTEHAAITRFRTQQCAASLAIVEELARIDGHGFQRVMLAMRTGQRAFEQIIYGHENTLRHSAS
jgi:hypothetical protein